VRFHEDGLLLCKHLSSPKENVLHCYFYHPVIQSFSHRATLTLLSF